MHFHTGKAKTASQLRDVSFNRSDEKMSGCKRSQTQTSRRGTESFCCLCVAAENFLSILLELCHIQMNTSTSFSAKTQQCKIWVFLKVSWSTCFFCLHHSYSCPVRIINSKPRWVKAHCGAGRLSHWSKPLQTYKLTHSDGAVLRTSARRLKNPRKSAGRTIWHTLSDLPTDLWAQSTQRVSFWKLIKNERLHS